MKSLLCAWIGSLTAPRIQTFMSYVAHPNDDRHNFQRRPPRRSLSARYARTRW